MKPKFDMSTTQGLLGAWRESAARATGKKPAASTSAPHQKPAAAVEAPKAIPTAKGVMGGSTTPELLEAWRRAVSPKKPPTKRQATREKIEKVREFNPELANEAEQIIDSLDAADAADDAADVE